MLLSTVAHAVDISNTQMRQASKSLTMEETDLVKKHIRTRMRNAKAAGDTEELERLESLEKSFYKGRFDVVMAELKALGDDPQKILRVTGLREKMLSGGLERRPWFIREIAGLDWFFEQDVKKAKKQWPKELDKVQYLIGLADQLDRNHKRADLDDVADATRALLTELAARKALVSRVFQRQVDQAVRKLNEVREDRGL